MSLERPLGLWRPGPAQKTSGIPKTNDFGTVFKHFMRPFLEPSVIDFKETSLLLRRLFEPCGRACGYPTNSVPRKLFAPTLASKANPEAARVLFFMFFWYILDHFCLSLDYLLKEQLCVCDVFQPLRACMVISVHMRSNFFRIASF